MNQGFSHSLNSSLAYWLDYRNAWRGLQHCRQSLKSSEQFTTLLLLLWVIKTTTWCCFAKYVFTMHLNNYLNCKNDDFSTFYLLFTFTFNVCSENLLMCVIVNLNVSSAYILQYLQYFTVQTFMSYVISSLQLNLPSSPLK